MDGWIGGRKGMYCSFAYLQEGSLGWFGGSATPVFSHVLLNRLAQLPFFSREKGRKDNHLKLIILFMMPSTPNHHPNDNNNNSTKLKLKIKRWHGVARWTWGVGSSLEQSNNNNNNYDDENDTGDNTAELDDDDDDGICIVCQGPYEGAAPGCKYPGDECPVVWGRCGHAFHLQCVSAWLRSQEQGDAAGGGGGSATPTCPTCRAEWEYGGSSSVATGATSRTTSSEPS